jgi:rod shape-determining protein MreD
LRVRNLGSPAPSYALEEPRWFVVAALLAAALLVQSTLAQYVTLRGAAPPLVLLVVGWYAIRAGTLRGLVFGLFAGACEDALAWNGVPAWTFATGAIGALAGRFRGTQMSESRFWLIAGAALAAFFRYGLFAVFEQLSGRTPMLGTAHLHAALWQSAYAALLSAVFVLLVPAVRRDA